MTAPFEITEEQIADCYEIADDARGITRWIDELERHVQVLIEDQDYLLHDSDLITMAILEEARKKLGDILADLVPKLADSMDQKQVTVVGAGTFERHRKKSRTVWDKDALLHAVLDTRLVDQDTGEVVDPTPYDKVLHVWNLGAPRTNALRQRGLDPDEYSHVEDGGWTIQRIGA